MTTSDHQPTHPCVTLAICTRERPDELRRLMDSLERSRFRTMGRPDIDVLVVDNTPGGSDLDPNELERRCGWPVRVVEEPRTGVAYARNTSIANRSPAADLFLCVDDDQTVAPSWLEAHLLCAARSSAPVITAPVLVRLPPSADLWAALIWKNIPRHPTGSSVPTFLGGNVCFRAAVFGELPLWYDESQATATADDADFGRRLVMAGYRIEWNDDAIAWEHVPEARLRLRWLVERFVSFGGFEAMWTRRYRGRRALVGQVPGQMVTVGRGAVAAASMAWPFQSELRRARHKATAVTTLSSALGWTGGVFGMRRQDYRRITSESPAASSSAQRASR